VYTAIGTKNTLHSALIVAIYSVGGGGIRERGKAETGIRVRDSSVVVEAKMGAR